MIVRVRSDYPQVQAKLASAIETLATHPGDVRSRLLAAFESLQTLDRADFPEEARDAFTWIIENLHLPKAPPLVQQHYENRHPPQVSAAVRYALSCMSHARGAEIARRLYQLHLACGRVPDQSSVSIAPRRRRSEGKSKSS